MKNTTLFIPEKVLLVHEDNITRLWYLEDKYRYSSHAFLENTTISDCDTHWQISATRAFYHFFTERPCGINERESWITKEELEKYNVTNETKIERIKCRRVFFDPNSEYEKIRVNGLLELKEKFNYGLMMPKHTTFIYGDLSKAFEKWVNA